MRHKIIIGIMLLMGLWSCQKEEWQVSKFSSPDLESLSDEVLFNLLTLDTGNHLRGDLHIIDSLVWYTSQNEIGIKGYNVIEDGDTLFYMINDEQLMEPLIGYGKGMISKEELSPAGQDFIHSMIEEIEDVRARYRTRKEYLLEVLDARIVDPDEPCQGSSLVYDKGPLLSTTWGQGCFYNAFLSTGCRRHCGRKLTGCVATAMAQVMNFHEWPTGYDWDMMLDSYSPYGFYQGEVEAVAELMLDAGSSVHMIWGCDASGAYSCTYTPSALRNDFQYSGTSNCKSGFNLQNVKRNISRGLPLILRGCREPSGCHAWVCDGVREYEICEINEVSGERMQWTVGFYSMNWGWDGRFDGWFTSTNQLYQKNTDRIENIKP